MKVHNARLNFALFLLILCCLMKTALITILLLVVSNIFMTFAWYGHLKLQSSGFKKLAIDSGNSAFVGNGFPRIQCDGAGQPDRIPRERRSIQSVSAQNHPGGDFADSFHGYRHVVVSRRETSLESRGCVSMSDGSSGVCIPSLKFVNIDRI